MMRTSIRRTMTTSTITSYKLVVEEGKPVIKDLPVLTVAGKLNEKQALKELYKVHGKDNSITIGNIAIDENVYEISVDDFIAHAKKVETTENK